MPISCVVLICLFMIQRYGSGKLSVVFSPIIAIWFVVLFVDGCISISQHPGVMKALNPAHAINYLVNDGRVDALAPVMLSITGVEAMFADVAHFGPHAVQISLGFVVYPCLMVCYLGQGSYLIRHPASYSNVFYESIPGGVGSGYYWFVFVMSTLSTIIASQALILGVFSIVKQLIILDCFPRFNLVYTSSKHKGKVYIPVVNYVLMVLVVVTTVCFKNSNNVTAAYGLGIAIDLIITTILLSICLHYVYHINIFVVACFFFPFGVLEACLIVAGLKKVPHGAWFPLMVSVISFVCISTWRWFRSLKISKEIDSKRSIEDLFDNKQMKKQIKEAMVLDLRKKGDDDADSISSIALEGDETRDENDHENDNENDPEGDTLDFNYKGKVTKIHRIPKAFLMYSAAASTNTFNHYLPNLFEHIVNCFSALPKVFILVETRVSTFPYLDEDTPKASLIKIDGPVPGFYRCIVRSGFMKQSRIDKPLLREILFQVTELQELMDYYKVDDPFMITGDLNIPVVEIFERDLISSKTLDQHMEDDLDIWSKKGKFNWRKIIRAPWWFIRENVINQVLSPFDGAINSSSMDYMIDTDLKNAKVNHESLYVSHRVIV
ncbi:unnamed protein product [Ambrosiozyma monospora]|uniref:Unnamed protein product n=1 Tax=Ambrosiozyma monospora TaxID=43982 RepID=A0ACB5T9E9_AMBMO|nr:unnamed protein product [Ambrosiozyma monospora]